jgi:hypothetical protein
MELAEQYITEEYTKIQDIIQKKYKEAFQSLDLGIFFIKADRCSADWRTVIAYRDWQVY